MLTNLRLENGVERLLSEEGKGERNRQARNGLSLRKHAQNLELYLESNKKVLMVGEESRWRRNRTGRSVSLLQIHRKNNRTVNKVYKTTSDC